MQPPLPQSGVATGVSSGWVAGAGATVGCWPSSVWPVGSVSTGWVVMLSVGADITISPQNHQCSIQVTNSADVPDSRWPPVTVRRDPPLEYTNGDIRCS